MKKLWIVTKNELLRYFISPLAYVYLVAFLLLNGSFAVYFGHFVDRGIAGLGSMFAFQPWLYLLFIPGISMRLPFPLWYGASFWLPGFLPPRRLC